MPKIVQEKFQVTFPDYHSKAEDDHGWVEDQSARAKKMMRGDEGRPGGDSASRFSMLAAMYNSLPPGSDIEDQEVVDIRKMGMSFNGNMPIGPATGDLTNHEVNAVSLRKGFDKKKLLQTDDAYTREHNDSFYDDVGGFCERNNYLDRL